MRLILHEYEPQGDHVFTLLVLYEDSFCLKATRKWSIYTGAITPGLTRPQLAHNQYRSAAPAQVRPYLSLSRMLQQTRSTSFRIPSIITLVRPCNDWS